MDHSARFWSTLAVYDPERPSQPDGAAEGRARRAARGPMPSGSGGLVRSSRDLIVETFERFDADGVPRIAAAMSYFLLLALAPVLLIVNAVLGIFGAQGGLRRRCRRRIRRVAGGLLSVRRGSRVGRVRTRRTCRGARDRRRAQRVQPVRGRAPGDLADAAAAHPGAHVPAPPSALARAARRGGGRAAGGDHHRCRRCSCSGRSRSSTPRRSGSTLSGVWLDVRGAGWIRVRRGRAPVRGRVHRRARPRDQVARRVARAR